MPSSRSAATLVVLIATMAHALLLFGGDKKKQQQNYKLNPDQVAELNDPKLIFAKQDCENWAFAAGLETMLRQQGVALDQNFWVMRMNYGEICAPGLPSMDLLAHVVNNEFVLQDGRHVALELHCTNGAPTIVDSVIAGLQHQQLSLLIFHGHIYYLVGVVYDEYIGLDGGRMFQLKELRLANTVATQPGVVFVRGRDDAGDIQGIITVSVSMP